MTKRDGEGVFVPIEETLRARRAAESHRAVGTRRAPVRRSSTSSVEARLRAFVGDGYRPEVRTHAMAYSEELESEGWVTLYLDVHPDYPERGPRRQSLGWVVNARRMRGEDETILGGTFGTIEQALAYAERERDKQTRARS